MFEDARAGVIGVLLAVPTGAELLPRSSRGKYQIEFRNRVDIVFPLEGAAGMLYRNGPGLRMLESRTGLSVAVFGDTLVEVIRVLLLRMATRAKSTASGFRVFHEQYSPVIQYCS